MPEPVMVTVRGRYLNQDDATPATGRLVFTLAQPLRVVDGSPPRVIVPYAVTATLTAGAFSVSLPSVPVDADNPAGPTYLVDELVDGRPRAYRVTLPTAGDFDMASAAAP